MYFYVVKKLHVFYSLCQSIFSFFSARWHISTLRFCNSCHLTMAWVFFCCVYAVQVISNYDSCTFSRNYFQHILCYWLFFFPFSSQLTFTSIERRFLLSLNNYVTKDELHHHYRHHHTKNVLKFINFQL